MLVIATALVAVPEAKAQVRVPGLSTRPPDRVAIYTVKGRGVTLPFIAFQERARRTVEAHMHAEIVSMDEALARGGPDLPKRLSACQGDPRCFTRELSSTLDARYLLVITASRVGRTRLVGARLLDLSARTVLGESIAEVPRRKIYTDAVPDRIRASVPADRWDPFGRVSVAVDQAGAQILINGRIIGLSPIDSVAALLPGVYRITAEKNGYLPVSRNVEIVRGRETKVGLTMKAQQDESNATTWWVVGGTLGAAVVATAIVLGVVFGNPGEDPSFCSAPDPAGCR